MRQKVPTAKWNNEPHFLLPRDFWGVTHFVLNARTFLSLAARANCYQVIVRFIREFQ